MKTFALSFIIFLSVNSCRKLDLFRVDGKIVLSERTVGPFNEIILNNNINLVLTQDTVNRITVEAGEHIQSSILTRVSNLTLTISNADAGILTKPGQLINVHASVKALQKISYQGEGNITCTNTLNSPYFLIVSNSGAGNVNLSLNTHMTTAGIYNENADFIFQGRSDTCYAYCSSRGTIDFRDFNINRLQIDYSGARDAYVFVTGALSGNIFYKGNIYYKGSPGSISVDQRNDGKLYPF